MAEGETGELLITGAQWTPGYWNDPESTHSAYLTPPGKHRLDYRTGDRVRRSQGTTPMVYLGRMDNPIKIQGYRVELGEGEATLRAEGNARSQDGEVGGRAVQGVSATAPRIVAVTMPEMTRRRADLP